MMIGFELPPFNSGGLGEACLALTKELSKIADITFLLPQKLPYPHTHMKLIFPEDILENQPNKIENARSAKSTIDTTNLFPSVYTKTKVEEFICNYENINNGMFEKGLKEDFDLIHAHDWMSVDVAVKLKKAKNKPLILQMHSTEIDRSPIEGVDKYKYDKEKYGMEMADKVIAVSEYTKKIIEKYYAIPSEKIEVVYNSLTSDIKPEKTVEKLKISGDIVLFVGRLTFQKGINQLLSVAKKVVEELPNTVFVVAGNGDMYRELIQNACKMSLMGNILFSGFVRGKEREIVYNSANAFLMPSISEPFGLVALEAISFGIPSVISKQSGVAEVIEGSIKVDFWDDEKMAQEIINILKNKKLREKIIKKQNESMNNINWEKSALKCNQIYNTV